MGEHPYSYTCATLSDACEVGSLVDDPEGDIVLRENECGHQANGAGTNLQEKGEN